MVNDDLTDAARAAFAANFKQLTDGAATTIPESTIEPLTNLPVLSTLKVIT